MSMSHALALACLIVAAGASQARAEPSGPSLSCMRTTASVDRQEAAIEWAICADPALAKLDVALDDAFHDAMANDLDDKAFLLDGQRAWLGTRASSCRIDRDGKTELDLKRCLGELYSTRIAALRDRDSRDLPVCRAVAERIRRARGYLASYSLGEGLREDPASPIVLGKAEPVTKALRAKLPGDLSDDQAGADSLYHFGAIRSLFAIDSVQGTAFCEYISLYKIVKGGAFAPLAPAEKNEECGGSTFFGSVADPAAQEAPVALYVPSSDTVEGSLLTLTSRRDEAWHPACTIATNFETKLSLGRRSCAKGVGCDALASRALDLARRRDAAGQKAPSRLGDGRRTPADGVKDQTGLPTFDAENVDAWASFENDAPVYELAGPDGPLLMRISHGTIGWRTNEDWLVGVYDRNRGTLDPLAGFMIKKLASAFAASRSAERRPVARSTG